MGSWLRWCWTVPRLCQVQLREISKLSVEEMDFLVTASVAKRIMHVLLLVNADLNRLSLLQSNRH